MRLRLSLLLLCLLFWCAKSHPAIPDVIPLELDRTIGELFFDHVSLKQPSVIQTKCYKDKISRGRPSLNIFNRSLPFRTIAEHYYETYPAKKPTLTSIYRLLNTTRDIIDQCQSGNSENRFGFNDLSDSDFWPAISDSSDIQISHANLVSSLWSDILDFFKKREETKYSCPPPDELCLTSAIEPDYLDWTENGCVSKVKHQGNHCNSCWAHASISAVESAICVASFKKHKKKQADVCAIDLSEQELVSCHQGPHCGFGNIISAFKHILTNGISQEKELPYNPEKKQSCKSAQNVRNRIYPLKRFCAFESPNDLQIKAFLSHYGPLAVHLENFPLDMSFSEGVITCLPGTNTQSHSVLLVGWNDDLWKLKNSWGPDWGEDGYFFIYMGRNSCNMNKWVYFPVLTEAYSE